MHSPVILSLWQFHLLRSGLRMCVFSKLSIGHWRVYCTVDWCVWGSTGFLFVFRKERFSLRFLLLSATCWLLGEFIENFTFRERVLWGCHDPWDDKIKWTAMHISPRRDAAKMKTKGHFSGLISMFLFLWANPSLKIFLNCFYLKNINFIYFL